MKRAKQEKLKKRGWAVGTVADFLALTPEEAAFVEIDRLERLLSRFLPYSDISRINAAEPGQAVEVDLLERPVAKSSAKAGKEGFTVSLAPHAIVSVKVAFES